jgi:alpha-glucosidase (family GH31 glycosyl hydrolase)
VRAGDEDSTWEAMRSSLTAGLTASACGIVYWGWDLAGFSGEIPDSELYLRAAALSCFVPIMQYHSEYNHHRTPSRDRSPFNIAERTGDRRVLPIFRKFARLRTRLVDYLAEQADLTIKSGRPLMQSVSLAYPKDPQCWLHPTQFLLGDDLLIAPVTEPDVTRLAAYLPEGRWVDVWTSQPVRGGQTTETDAPLDRIPVWCRAESWSRMAPIFDTTS